MCSSDLPKDKQISESSVLAYLGQRGYAGYVNVAFGNSITIKRNAVPLLAYYDIFKITMPINKKNTFIQ